MAQTTTAVGRALLLHPDRGFDVSEAPPHSGLALHTALNTLWTSVSNHLVSRWTGSVTLLNTETTTVTHNFNLAIAKLKIMIFESGVQLTEDQISASYVVSQVSVNAISIQNVSGVSKTFHASVLCFRFNITSADVDPSFGKDKFLSKTSNFNAADGEKYIVNSSGGAFTATLPASPVVGTRIEFIDARGSFAAFPLTLDRNTKNINGLGSNYQCDVNDKLYVATYLDATRGWSINFS